MDARPSQRQIRGLLRRVFNPADVQSEWSIRIEASDTFGDRATYAPRLDIVVGPFNSTAQDIGDDVRRIKHSSRNALIQKIIRIGKRQNDGHFGQNENPRCLLAIEIEFSGSSKHIPGDFTNASMMGLVGVVIGSRTNFRKVKRVGEYARKLRSVRKAPPDLFANTVYFRIDDFVALLRQIPTSRRESVRTRN